MTDEIEILGLFDYEATVLMPRRRVPSRIQMFGRTTYAIATTAKPDAPEALRIRRGRHEDDSIYVGHRGRLYVEMTAHPHPKLDVATYQGLMDPFAANEIYSDRRPRGLRGLRSGDPLSRAALRLPAASTRETSAVPAKDAYAFEETFEGQVVWSNRTESMLRHQAVAASDLLAIGGTMHARSAGPRWDIHPSGSEITLVDAAPFATQQFRLDRLQDAQAFARRWRGRDLPVHGSVLAADPDYVAGDDIAYAFRHVDTVVLKKIAEYGQYLPAEATAAWAFLVHGCTHSGNDIDGVDEPARFAEALRAVVDACAAPSVPPDLGDLIRKDLGFLAERMAFERDFARTPSAVAGDDEEALAALARHDRG